jgi:hypothetical protein
MVQQPAFTDACFTRDGIQRERRDTIPAGNHCRRLQQLLMQAEDLFSVLGFHIHGPNHTDQTV